MPANIRRPTGTPLWLEPYNRNVEREIDKARLMGRYAVADAPPAASNTNSLIYVPDESGGPALAFSDGTNWLRVTLGPPIS